MGRDATNHLTKTPVKVYIISVQENSAQSGAFGFVDHMLGGEGMTAYYAIISDLETRHGKIDNIKFLVNDLTRPEIDMVIDEFVAAASSYLCGSLKPVKEFSDKGFAATRFER